jgi:hypothetical protein
VLREHKPKNEQRAREGELSQHSGDCLEQTRIPAALVNNERRNDDPDRAIEKTPAKKEQDSCKK